MFSEDNKVIRFLTRLFDLMLLNILFILCSLPIVTVGASITALYSVVLKMARDEEGYIAKGFLSAFRSNFAQSTIVWAFLAFAGGVLWADVSLVQKTIGVLHTASSAVFCILALFYVIEFIFVFPLIATFVNTVPNMMKNALLIPISRLPVAVAILVMDGLCVFLSTLNTFTMLAGLVFWLILGIALVAYANAFLINRMLAPFLKE